MFKCALVEGNTRQSFEFCWEKNTLAVLALANKLYASQNSENPNFILRYAVFLQVSEQVFTR